MMPYQIGKYYTVSSLLEKLGPIRDANAVDFALHFSKISAIREYLSLLPLNKFHFVALPQIGVRINAAVVKTELNWVEVWANAQCTPTAKASFWRTQESCNCCATEREFIRADTITFSFRKFYFTNNNTLKQGDTESTFMYEPPANHVELFELFRVQHMVDHMTGRIQSSSKELRQEPFHEGSGGLNVP